MTETLSSTCCSSTLSLQRRKRLRAQTRCTPWRDTWELEEVGRALMHATSLFDTRNQGTRTDQADDDLQSALSRVAVWKSKSDQGRIPHSIETTATLAEILWRDANKFSSTMELRLAYSAALLRGVNGIADVMQNHRASAASVASLCDMVGLPGWLVDMRHDAAHNDLPTLPALRLAAITFLGFLQERYWATMINKRDKAREEAFKLLRSYNVAFKQSSPSAVSGDASQQEVEESSDSTSADEGLDDPDAELWGKSVGTNQNRFAALTEIKTKKPSIKCKTQKGKKPVAATVDPAKMHCARQFVKTVPIDVGFQVALSFLVWGDSLSPSGHGALIPDPSVAFPATTVGEEKIRREYKPLLQTLCGAWPGFAAALLMHLVDFMLSIENGTSSDNHQGDAGSTRKLYFLALWVRFLVSREFHMWNDPSLGRINRHSRNLAKKPESEWTKTERSFVQGTAPLEVLQQAKFPLNSLCDRCTRDGSPLAETSSTVTKLFSDILGDSRTPGMGLGALLPSPSKPQVDVHERKRAKTSLDTTKATVGRVSGGMSLAEMEALLSDSDQEAEQTDKKAGERASNGDVETTQLQPSSTNLDPGKLSAWVQCESWDACAIGSLPGYPV